MKDSRLVINQGAKNQTKVAGERFPWRPILDYIFVADYGQPDRSEGGLFLGDFNFGNYRFDHWRYGEVIAMGNGRFNADGIRMPMPEISVGDVVIFSRKHGTRLPGDVRFAHPRYPSPNGLLVRVLDPSKTVGVCEGFVPWWDVASRQIDPGSEFSG